MSDSHLSPDRPFRAVHPAPSFPISLEDLAHVLLTDLVEFEAPARERYLPKVTEVDSIRVVTNGDGLDADVAEMVARLLQRFPAAIIVEGKAVKPSARVAE